MRRGDSERESHSFTMHRSRKLALDWLHLAIVESLGVVRKSAKCCVVICSPGGGFSINPVSRRIGHCHIRVCLRPYTDVKANDHVLALSEMQLRANTMMVLQSMRLARGSASETARAAVCLWKLVHPL